MKDWSAIAAGTGIPAADRERTIKPLETLEEAFRPLAESLTFADEPAATFDAAEEAE